MKENHTQEDYWNTCQKKIFVFQMYIELATVLWIEPNKIDKI